MKLDLICIGNPSIDDIVLANGKRLEGYIGGADFNTAMAFSQLGGTVGIVGRIGEDKEGEKIRSFIRKYGIDAKRLRIDNNPTDRYTLATPAGKEYREIIPGEHNSRLKKLTKKDVTYLHMTKAIMTRITLRLPEIARIAKERSIDLYLSAHGYHGINLDLRGFPIRAIVGEENEIREVKSNCITNDIPIITTLGADGSISIFHNKTAVVPAYKVQVKDTTGAGDAFLAGFIYADMQALPMIEKLRYGNACGAITVKGYGAQQRLNLRMVKYYLNKY